MRVEPVLASLWNLAQLSSEALPHARLTGADPVFPSSFAVGAAAQAAVAAAALAACEVGYARGQPRQDVHVDMLHAALECVSYYSIDGREPPMWDPISGLYRAADGWVRVHANFEHHRNGALRLLGLQPGTAKRADVERAMLQWRAVDYEQAAAERGLVATAARRFDEWDAHPAGKAIAAQPLMSFERLGDAPPKRLPSLGTGDLPLHGVRVLELTRILAGPTGGRTLAAYGADVMLVNAPHLPNIEMIATTSRGKLSSHVDLRSEQGRRDMDALVAGAHVFAQGYRPGGLDALGYGPRAVAQRHPGIVYISLTAYGDEGPWRERRGFDSLLQTAMGFNCAEGEAAEAPAPKPMPFQILDCAAGFLMAFGAAAALERQIREGGSWHVRVSLAQTAHWLRGLGRIDDGLRIEAPDERQHLESSASGFGPLVAVSHSAQLSRTPARWMRPSVPPGTHAPVWP